MNVQMMVGASLMVGDTENPIRYPPYVKAVTVKMSTAAVVGMIALAGLLVICKNPKRAKHFVT